MKLKILIFSCLMFFATLTTQAQYSTGVGARLGDFSGLTIKHFLGENAIEGLIAWRDHGWAVTALYEYHKPFSGVSELKWFVGVGAHIGFWDRDKYWNHKDKDDDDGDDYTIIGIDFIGGIEYTFKDVPFCLALDLKPALNFIGDSSWWWSGAFSIRYCFK